jgi:predicted Zn finger-like uncharacterized protein
MLIVCPNCATSYRVEPSSLGAAGRSVRCVRCRTIWFTREPGALAAVTRDFRVDAGSPATETAAADRAEASAPFPGADAEFEQSSPAVEAIDPGSLPEQAPAVLDAPAEPAPPPVAAWSDHDLDQPREPVAIDHLPAPSEHDGAGLPADTTPAEDIETFAARRLRRKAARRRAHWPLPGLPTAILALVALNAALIGWRAEVVRFLPQTASLYAAIGLPVNLRGLAFANVASATETHDGVPVLVVEGAIVNAKDRAAEVPRLRFSVRNQQGQEIYAWTALPGRSVLAPGETLPFRSRLASPPPEAHDVLVRFFNRRDRVAGIR